MQVAGTILACRDEEQMSKRAVLAAVCVLFCCGALRATDSGGRTVKLVPTPQEVHVRDGGYRVNRHTRILVQFGHQAEDRIAAETLAEQVADQSGLQLDIIGAKSGRKMDDGVIVLARLEDARVRQFLAAKGLRGDELGDQGYLLFSDESHLIVAANSGQGLFSGVQTLRQLLSPAGKHVFCPAIAIRDWPSLQPPDGSNLSREVAPAFPRPRA